MSDFNFPRTEIGGVSVSRLVAGSNWWLGYTHQTRPRGAWNKAGQSAETIADVLEVFIRGGVNVTMGPPTEPLPEGIDRARQRTGAELHFLCTPWFDLADSGVDWDSAARALDEAAELGATFCWPHAACTDRLYDGLTRTIRDMDRVCAMIREREMVPGLSTHRPEVIRAADAAGLDVASYICIYNCAGFLMPYEIDWAQRLIQEAAKPVTTIKPMAAGRVMPYVGLPFSWATIREIDLVTAGTMTADEAREVIDLSLAAIEGRTARHDLAATRSKAALQ